MTALALLISAVQLLTLVLTTPSLPPSFREAAVFIAQQAITASKAELSQNPAAGISTSTIDQLTVPTYSQPIQPASQPSTLYAMPEPTDRSAILIIVSFLGERSVSTTTPYGEYGIKVQVLDPKGKPTKGALVMFTRPADDKNIEWNSNPNERLTLNDTTPNANDWSTDFGYIPSTAGDKKLTFTSGSLSQTYQLTVQ